VKEGFPFVLGALLQGVFLGVLLFVAIVQLYVHGSGAQVFRYQGF
jgi:hypothetical protein